MKKYFGVSILLLLVIIINAVGCASQPVSTINSAVPNNPSLLKSTKITPQPGDNLVSSSALLVPMDIDQLIKESECALIGKVTTILPSKKTTDNLLPGFAESGMIMVHTDVIIQPEKYLFGGENNDGIAVRVEGGRIDDYVLVAEDQPVFTEGENVLVFLYREKFTAVPSGIDPSNYFLVKGMIQGEYLLKEGGYVNSFSGKSISLSALQQKIVDSR